jgi:hypothetical protein
MPKPRYPFTYTSFGAHETAVYSLGAVIILIAMAIGWVLWLPTITLPPHMPMVLGVGAVALFLVWIWLLTTFDSKKVALRIRRLEHLEQVLLDVIHRVDATTKLEPAQKRVVLEPYIDAMRRVDEETAKKHLKHACTQVGAIYVLLEELDREAAAEAIEKIKENGGMLPHHQVTRLNELSMDYVKMRMAIQPT